VRARAHHAVDQALDLFLKGAGFAFSHARTRT
jgi:hypothetical protein